MPLDKDDTSTFIGAVVGMAVGQIIFGGGPKRRRRTTIVQQPSTYYPSPSQPDYGPDHPFWDTAYIPPGERVEAIFAKEDDNVLGKLAIMLFVLAIPVAIIVAVVWFFTHAAQNHTRAVEHQAAAITVQGRRPIPTDTVLISNLSIHSKLVDVNSQNADAYAALRVTVKNNNDFTVCNVKLQLWTNGFGMSARAANSEDHIDPMVARDACIRPHRSKSDDIETVESLEKGREPEVSVVGITVPYDRKKGAPPL